MDFSNHATKQERTSSIYRIFIKINEDPTLLCKMSKNSNMGLCYFEEKNFILKTKLQ